MLPGVGDQAVSLLTQYPAMEIVPPIQTEVEHWQKGLFSRGTPSHTGQIYLMTGHSATTDIMLLIKSHPVKPLLYNMVVMVTTTWQDLLPIKMTYQITKLSVICQVNGYIIIAHIINSRLDLLVIIGLH